MRVLHLPIVICNQPWEMSRALRKIGIESDYMVLDDNDSAWLMPGPPDYNLNIYHRFKEKDAKRINNDIRRFFFMALFKYDVFHYHSNIPLFDDFWDLRILKSFKKKIVVSYWGCDIRLKKINSRYKFNTCEVCRVNCQEKEKLRRKQIFDQYADLKIAHSFELKEYADLNTIVLPVLINTDFWKPSQVALSDKKSNIFQVMNAFGNKEDRGDVRGSIYIRKAVDKLKKEGHKIDFLLHDKLSPGQLKMRYQQADIIVEQLRYGTFGLTALEAMAMEKPVIGYIRQDLLKYYPGLPIINASPETIYQTLKLAINRRIDLKTIGEVGRKYVIDRHNLILGAHNLYQIYKSLF